MQHHHCIPLPTSSGLCAEGSTVPGMGAFRRTHTCIDNLLKLVKFSPFPLALTERLNQCLCHIYIFSQLQVPGAYLLSSIHISQLSKFLQLWLRKNYFAPESQTVASFQLPPTGKELLSSQRHPPNSARTVFLQEELSSTDTTKRKILKMQNFNTNL